MKFSCAEWLEQVTHQKSASYLKLFKKQLVIMKLTTLFILIASVQVSAKTLGQKVTLRAENAPLESIFSSIEKQTGFSFIYNEQLLKGRPGMTIAISNMPLSQALKKILDEQDIQFVVRNAAILLRRKLPLNSSPQDYVLPDTLIDVSGRVIDEKEEPVYGATIYLKGTAKHTSTDENGNFILKGVNPSSTITITSIGFNSITLGVENRKSIIVSMKIAVSDLQTVSVSSGNTGYQAIPKERATGSYTIVDNELFNRRVSTNLIDRIDGVTSGVLFNKGRQGNDPTISVRGRSTIFANAEPLIILDNFPYDGNISNINPNDVENITVLKDAAAASIWGARSGNGVIVITTKKGRIDRKPAISINANTTIGAKPDLYYVPQLSSSEFIEVERFLFDKGRYNSIINNGYAAISPVVAILLRQRNGMITKDQADAEIEGYKNLDIRDHLKKYVYQNSVNQQYSINLSGGGDNQVYYVSAGYDKNTSNLIGSGSSRATINMNNTYYLFNKKLAIESGLIFTSTSTKSGAALSFKYPYDQLVDQNGNPAALVRDLRKSYTDTAGQGLLLDWQYKPLNERDLISFRSNTTDYRLNQRLSYTIVSGLTATLNYQYGRGMTEGTSVQDKSSYSVRNQVNLYSSINYGSRNVTRVIPIGDILGNDFTLYRAHYGRAQLSYSKTWNKVHKLDVLAAFEVKDYANKASSQLMYGYDKSTEAFSIMDFVGFYPIFTTKSSARIQSGLIRSSGIERFRSKLANFTYSYKGRYLLSGSIRKDESNLFGVAANQKGVPLYSFGGAWIASGEDFFYSSIFNNLKLRATYGYSGNLDKTVSAFTTARTDGNDIYGNQIATVVNPPNPSLRWERSEMINLGVDFNLKNGIVDGSVDFFRKKGVDLIAFSPIAPQTGIVQFKGNAANTRTKGVDIVLNLHALQRTLKWDINLLYNYANDKVTKNVVKQASALTYMSGNYNNPLEGRPYSALFAFQFKGLDTLGNPIGISKGENSINYTAITTSTDFNDMKFMGNRTPTHFGSLRNSFQYGALQLSFNTVFKLGYYFRRKSIDNSSLYANSSGYQFADYNARWKNKGDELFTNVPALIYLPNGARDNFYTYSDVLVEKGDHIRLQDIQISYRLNMNSKMGMKSINFYAYINNVGILWRANKYKIDPDVLQNAPPAPRTYSIGANISL